ncbi:MAG: hypothetical protein GXO90_07360 [FCB group bacterium]|nr:hypothetical protein [FCB group bacterium]
MTCKYKLIPVIALAAILQGASPVIVSTGWDLFNNAADGRWSALGGTVIGGTTTSGISVSNPAQFRTPGKLSLYHQSRFAGFIQEDAVAFTLPALHDQPVLLIREGINRISDTRDMLLDWGEDGQPGTGDTGEGNGQLDPGERLDRDQLGWFSQSRWGVYLPRTLRWKSLDLGYAVKGMFQSLGAYHGLGFGVDIGGVRALTPRWSLGFTLSDAFTSIKIWDSGRTEITLPKMGVGLSGRIPLPGKTLSLLVILNSEIRPSVRDLSDDFHVGSSGGNVTGGVEVDVRDKLFIRLGRNSVQSLTGGLGLNWKHVTVNYALQMAPPGSDLGQTHLVSFDLDTGWMKETLRTAL